MKRSAVTLSLFALLVACQSPQAPPASAPAAAPAPAATAPVPAPEPEPTVAPPATEAVPGDAPRTFLCRGNEPFWALHVRTDGATFKTPEAELELVGSLKANAGGSFAFRGTSGKGSEGEVSALIAPGQCFDSMADGPAAPFSAQVSFADGQVASGCCSVD